MARFGDSPQLVGPGSELQLMIDGRAVRPELVADATALGEVLEQGAEQVSLYVAGERLVARTTTASTRC